MKRLIATMLISLSVVACEQQTLFAPHYTDYGGSWGVASKTSPQNSLRSAVRVNRLAPLSGTSNYCGAPKCAPSRIKLLGAAMEPNPIRLPDNGPNIIDPDDCPRVIDPDDCPRVIDPDDCPEIIDPNDFPRFMKDDGPAYPDPTRIERPVFGPHILSF
jgi:hypothetical protein